MNDPWPVTHTTFFLGDRVEKIRGASWRGRIVGWYATSLTPEGYAVESENEPGSVQIYPAAALRGLA
jgi:dihydrofolate reductase (trimethoprim resistance protein)